jgi:hypothetical protein
VELPASDTVEPEVLVGSLFVDGRGVFFVLEPVGEASGIRYTVEPAYTC